MRMRSPARPKRLAAYAGERQHSLPNGRVMPGPVRDALPSDRSNQLELEGFWDSSAHPDCNLPTHPAGGIRQSRDAQSDNPALRHAGAPAAWRSADSAFRLTPNRRLVTIVANATYGGRRRNTQFLPASF
jgi:hypothetical protein